jgi:hypothetical protein
MDQRQIECSPGDQLERGQLIRGKRRDIFHQSFEIT